MEEGRARQPALVGDSDTQDSEKSDSIIDQIVAYITATSTSTAPAPQRKDDDRSHERRAAPLSCRRADKNTSVYPDSSTGKTRPDITKSNVVEGRAELQDLATELSTPNNTPPENLCSKTDAFGVNSVNTANDDVLEILTGNSSKEDSDIDQSHPGKFNNQDVEGRAELQDLTITGLLSTQHNSPPENLSSNTDAFGVHSPNTLLSTSQAKQPTCTQFVTNTATDTSLDCGVSSPRKTTLNNEENVVPSSFKAQGLVCVEGVSVSDSERLVDCGVSSPRRAALNHEENVKPQSFKAEGSVCTKVVKVSDLRLSSPRRAVLNKDGNIANSRKQITSTIRMRRNVMSPSRGGRCEMSFSMPLLKMLKTVNFIWPHCEESFISHLRSQSQALRNSPGVTIEISQRGWKRKSPDDVLLFGTSITSKKRILNSSEATALTVAEGSPLRKSQNTLPRTSPAEDQFFNVLNEILLSEEVSSIFSEAVSSSTSQETSSEILASDSEILASGSEILASGSEILASGSGILASGSNLVTSEETRTPESKDGPSCSSSELRITSREKKSGLTDEELSQLRSENSPMVIFGDGVLPLLNEISARTDSDSDQDEPSTEECNHIRKLGRKQVTLLGVRPSLEELAKGSIKNLVKGFCGGCCLRLSPYTAVVWVERKDRLDPYCPACFEKGSKKIVALHFWFHLVLKDVEDKIYEAVCSREYAEKFLGCTRNQFLNEEKTRQWIHRKLRFFIDSKDPFHLTLIEVKNCTGIHHRVC